MEELRYLLTFILCPPHDSACVSNKTPQTTSKTMNEGGHMGADIRTSEEKHEKYGQSTLISVITGRKTPRNVKQKLVCIICVVSPDV